MMAYQILLFFALCDSHKHFSYNSFTNIDNANEFYFEFLRINLFTRQFFASQDHSCWLEKGPFCLLGQEPLNQKQIFLRIRSLFHRESNTNLILIVDFDSKEVLLDSRVRIKGITEVSLTFFNGFIAPDRLLDKKSSKTQFYGLRVKMLDEILSEIDQKKKNYRHIFYQSLFDQFDETNKYPSSRFLIAKPAGATINFNPSIKLRGLYFKTMNLIPYVSFIKVKKAEKVVEVHRVFSSSSWVFLRFDKNVICDELYIPEGVAIDNLSFYENLDVNLFNIVI